MDKIPKLRKKFVDGCIKNSSIDKSLADKIFSDIEYFGGYGFNRAHAASYAMISYITAYLKTHYTAEYMAALLTSVAGNKDKLFLYLNDCKKLGIKVLPPSINYSGIDFEVIDKDQILFGLASVNGIGISIAESIIKGRDNNKPYISIYDFYKRCDPSVLKKSTLEHLANSGALDELIETDDDNDINRSIELSILEKEKEELGIYVTKHPLEGTWDVMKASIDIEIIEVPECTPGAYLKLGGIITSSKKIITKKGARMFKFNLEDPTGEIEVIVFPKDAKGYSDESFRVGDIVYVSGSLNRETEDENSSNRIFLSNLEKVDNATMYSGKAIYLNYKNINSLQLKKIYDIIINNNGNRQVFLNVVSDLGTFVYKFNKTTNKNAEKLIKNIMEES
jgi:DNA polymerase-3 subunit alpha